MGSGQLGLSLVGAAVVGAAAGAGASLALTPRVEPQVAAPAPELVQRLKAVEQELASARAALEDSRKSMGTLEERVAAEEVRAARAGIPHAVDIAGTASQSGLRRHRAPRPDATGAVEATEAQESPQIAFANDSLGGQLAEELGKALEGVEIDLPEAGGLEELKSSLALRRLPEDQRWDKAKSDLGLSPAQVDDLKRAIADRDTAVKDAATTEKKSGPNGGAITIRRSDPAKVAHAQADYHDRVAQTLDADQRKNWQQKGYENAFGGGPFGGTATHMVMTMDVSSDKTDPAAKDAAK